MEHHRREHFIPKLFDTQPYDSWVKTGSKEIREKAREEIKRILKEHQPPPLDEELEQKLWKYVKETEMRGANSGGYYEIN
jgi:trimethylamine:corrinoid methyltransferase-like protein